MRPKHPALVGRRQVRFEGHPTGQLHQDGSTYAALLLNLTDVSYQPDAAPKRLYQIGLELNCVAMVQAAAAWAAETGAAGDLMLSAALHRFDADDPVHVLASEHGFHDGKAMPFPATPAQITADLAAIVTDKHEAVVAACALVSDLLADMGAPSRTC